MSPCGRYSARITLHTIPERMNPKPMNTSASNSSPRDLVVTPEELLQYWQGHRRVTRRVIDAFPEDQLFHFSIGGMRPFGVLAMEITGMAAPTVEGVATGEWDAMGDREARPKKEVLRRWDESTEQIDTRWPQIPPERFQETMTAFGQWEMPGYDLLFYAIDNEIHHRGQGYVYLRALDVEPPFFYDRS